jgi:hypothetical protein
MVKFVQPSVYADPEAAMQKLLEIANGVEAKHEGRIHIEKINGPMLFELGAKPSEYKAALMLAIERGYLVLHESGTYVRFTEKGAELFA